MRELGVLEAKNRLSELLDAVEHGEEVMITRRGRPVAKLVSATGGIRPGSGSEGCGGDPRAPQGGHAGRDFHQGADRGGTALAVLVLDASATLAWYFADEASPAAEALLDHVRDRGAVVPAIWKLEVANSLQSARRRHRISTEYRDNFLRDLARLPITTDAETNDHAWTRTVRLSDDFAAARAAQEARNVLPYRKDRRRLQRRPGGLRGPPGRVHPADRPERREQAQRSACRAIHTLREYYGALEAFRAEDGRPAVQGPTPPQKRLLGAPRGLLRAGCVTIYLTPRWGSRHRTGRIARFVARTRNI